MIGRPIALLDQDRVRVHRDVEGADPDAEQDERREQEGKARGKQGQRQHGAEQERRRARRGPTAVARGERARDRQRGDRPAGDREQGEPEHALGQPVPNLDVRDVRQPAAEPAAVGEEQGRRRQARLAQVRRRPPAGRRFHKHLRASSKSFFCCPCRS
jgi:hypothetical protein